MLTVKDKLLSGLMKLCSRLWERAAHVWLPKIVEMSSVWGRVSVEQEIQFMPAASHSSVLKQIFLLSYIFKNTCFNIRV